MRKKLAIFLAIFIIILAIFGLGKQILSALEAAKRLDFATDRFSKLQEENIGLNSQLEKVKRADFVEEQARNKLNLARSKEAIVIIPEEQIQQILGLNKKEAEIKLPNWQGWLNLIFH